MSEKRYLPRMRVAMERTEQQRRETKERLRPQYTELNERELNLKVLEYLSGDKIPEKAWELCLIDIPAESAK